MRVILDASALIIGVKASKGEEYYTVMGAVEEVHSETARLAVELSVQDGSLRVLEPGKESSKRALEVARETGDIGHLSGTDLQLLALGIEFHEQGIETAILTDDYAVQNIAQKLGIRHVPIAETGIKKYLTWKNICKGCGKRFSQEYRGNCDHCGSQVVRRAKGK